MGILIGIVILLFSVILHEYMHGKIADYLGDPTARLAGRLTLDPRPHIDPVGSILVPLFLIISTGGQFFFAWAKPVPFDPYNLKDPRRDSALISLAGPGTNLVLALVGALLIRLIILVDQSILQTIGSPLFFLVYINLILGIFNLLPVAPLDGFKIVGGLLPDRQARDWYSLERYGMIFLLALLLPLGSGGSMLSSILGPLVEFFLKILLPAQFGMGLV